MHFLDWNPPPKKNYSTHAHIPIPYKKTGDQTSDFLAFQHQPLFYCQITIILYDSLWAVLLFFFQIKKNLSRHVTWQHQNPEELNTESQRHQGNVWSKFTACEWKNTLPAVKWETAASESHSQLRPSRHPNDIIGSRMWRRGRSETQFLALMRDELTAGNPPWWISLDIRCHHMYVCIHD